jgi:RNA polymerase sigma-70 factor (ECF subfamily)
METPDFDKFLAALRAGDERAAAELVRRYEPYLRQVIRMRLTDPCLRRVFDSVDICQSVLGEFFVRMADGRFQFQDPDRLRALLVTMALNKLIDRVRRERHHGGGLPEDLDAPGPVPAPDEQALSRDLVQAIRDRLSPRECRVVDQRLQGRTWPEIAANDGGQPDALRILYARAVARVRRELAGELADVP